MANKFTANPNFIDTAMGAGSGQKGLRVSQIVWNVGATGGTLTITDAFGNGTLAVLEGAANAQVSQSFAQPRRWADYKIASIPSGSILIFLV